jgi:hypothetical protein
VELLEVVTRVWSAGHHLTARFGAGVMNEVGPKRGTFKQICFLAKCHVHCKLL